MPDIFMFEKPIGMRDTLPDLFRLKESVRSRMAKETKLYGYRFLDTPSLEFYETVGQVSAIKDQQLFKLLDKEGHSLVLRPDMTSPIARVASSHLLKEGNPLRMAYSANVFRAQEKEGGRLAEFEQFGVEMIGDKTLSADAEVLALLTSVLQAAGLPHYHITVGHIAFVQEMLLHYGGNEEQAGMMRRFLFEKNYVGYREYVMELDLPENSRQILKKLPELKGNAEVLDQALEMMEHGVGTAALYELKALASMLKKAGINGHLSYDLSLVSHMDYYTGILFEVLGSHIGFPLGNGGRYNELYRNFGHDAPATGFGLRLDRIIEAIGEIDAEEQPLCIIYHEAQQSAAMKKAAALRAEGHAVVTQNIAGIVELDTFTNNFKNIVYMIDSDGWEAGS
ncbi:ATP phosphoribosyltransferase regulatory subunit [Bacillus sp. FJAT-27916]|uniref:ATP phosphoribosyltransferase regulatory subunit n=1 Tax=Bacillus sp. FJAT-27916 TaxID=1679169 RepID=UPI000AABA046|nr:ATP phosphoribosyltransferase regulatory subunit [Bacillus sp. FJAT-27916]